MIFEIINPSDAYTMETDNFIAACVATCLLGNGAYALEEIGGDKKMPVFLFGGHDIWFTEQFGKSFERCVDDVSASELADCLDSVLIGKPQDRETYKRGLELIDDPAKREQWHFEWHDKRRSSMNNIGGRAWRLAERLRQRQSQ